MEPVNDAPTHESVHAVRARREPEQIESARITDGQTGERDHTNLDIPIDIRSPFGAASGTGPSSPLKKCSVGESAASQPRPRSRIAALSQRLPQDSATKAWAARTARSQDDFFNGLLGLATPAFR